MSADTKNIPDRFAAELASFDDKLHATASNVDMLAEIQEGIGHLLQATDNSEAQIRRILQERYESGALRKETFQLVKSMLDRYVSENIPTSATTESLSPAAIRDPANETPTAPVASTIEDGDDQFGSTTVIPVDAVPDLSPEGRVQVGSLLRDRFLLQEKISGGSMGVVYKAMDRRLAEAGSQDHWVAIKVLSPQLAENGQALRALQQEAAKGRCLVHPNIVRFIDLDRDDDLYFLVMEWLEGRTLADILDSKDSSAIDSKAAFRITRQVGAALEYAHSRGIVHADVKPGNIMVLPNGDAKLFDFGVARVRQQHTETEFDPGVLGAMTPAYSSMQVLTGEEPNAADDVFSLSCLLYRLLAGYRVFGPRNAAEASQEGMAPQRLKGINDSQWRALKKGLSYARVTRFASVAEFIKALDVDQDVPFRVEDPDRFVAAEERGGVGKWIVAFILLLVLGAGVAYQQGYLDNIIDDLVGTTAQPRAIEDDAPIVTVGEIVPAATEAANDDSLTTAEPAVEALAAGEPALDQPDSELAGDLTVENSTVGETRLADDLSAALLEPGTDTPVTEQGTDERVAEPANSGLLDFSTLPPATEIVPFTPGRSVGLPLNVAIREDGSPVIIDFVRGSNLSQTLTLRLEEVGFSGNRSPWGSGQYALSNAGMIHFPAGQSRGRVTITMASDPLREADQQSTLRLRDADSAESELAVINLRLEDDDQRQFEARLPENAVAFTTNQINVSESDPAVQINIVRFNPDNASVVVEYAVHDITATQGVDYFAPGEHVLTFGPGQRSGRLLIPLVQDAQVEGDESFVVELASDPGAPTANQTQRIVVTIRDDESRSP